MRLNALHPAVVVIENKGEYLAAKDYPLYAMKISAADDNIRLYLNIMKGNIRQWFEIGAEGGGSGIDGLTEEIAERKAADITLMNAITANANNITAIVSATTTTIARKLNSGEYIINIEEPNTLRMNDSDDPVVLRSYVDYLERRLAIVEDKLIPRYTINFYSYNSGSLFESMTVKENNPVNPPATSPTRDGYAFLGWDTPMPFNAVSDKNIYGTWERDTFTVKFYNYSGGSVISTQSIKKGHDAVPPAAPTRQDYTFTGWNGDYTNIQADTNIYGTWEKTVFTVKFYTYVNGSLIKTQKVNKGGDALAPADPVRDGWIFDGWDKPFNNVTSDLNVYGTWHEAPITGPDLGTEWRTHAKATDPNTTDRKIQETLRLYPFSSNSSTDMMLEVDTAYPNAYQQETDSYVFTDAELEAIADNYRVPVGYSVYIESMSTFAVMVPSGATFTHQIWDPTQDDYIDDPAKLIYSYSGTDYTIYIADTGANTRIIVS